MNGNPGLPASGPGLQPATDLLQSQSPDNSTTKISPDKASKFSQFKSGFSGLPGKISGHFQSLSKQPVNRVPTLIPSSPKAYSVAKPPPSDIGQKIQLAVDAELAAYPYHRSFANVADAVKSAEGIDDTVLSLGSWDTARPLALSAGKAAKLSTKGADGFIFDEKSGLTAYVLHNPKSDPPEVRLVFGGTTSGKKTGGLTKRSALNGAFTLKQWVANAKNAAFGKTPDSYKQAKELASKVQNMMAVDPTYKDFTLTISGHSKGGGEAAYAALSLKEPVQAICFSSAELGRTMHKSFSEEQKANASRYITHYNIEGDPVPNVSKALGGLGHLGKVVTLPSDGSGSNPLDRHDKFNRHICHYANS